MDTFETLKLNRESSLIPISEVPEHLRARFDSSKAVFVLSRSTARRGALALDKNGAAFVKLFQDGETLPQALKKLSLECKIPIEELVKSAYPLLERLIHEEHLIPANDETETLQEQSRRTLGLGSSFRGYKIVSLVQQLDDTVVYKALDSQEKPVALKVIRGRNSPAYNSFRREIMILNHLQGSIAPKLIEAHTEGEDPFIAMEWIEGYSLVDWASRIRNLRHQECYKELKTLAVGLLTTYKQLHENGVLHGDIWTRNILIDRTGRIRLLDFGLSWFAPANELLGLPDRATNAYFRSPDLAAAELAGTQPPASSIASEIYSLGVMLYYILTGKTYIHFSYELDEQLKQVCEAPMIPFKTQGAPSWPDMEALLAMMLKKSESDRISSLDACLEHLANTSYPKQEESLQGRADVIPFLRSYSGEQFSKPIEAPSASIFFGVGGLAYSMLLAGISLEEPKLFADSDYLTACARLWITSGPEGSSNPDADIPDHLLGSHSIFHRIEGIALLEALVAHTMGDARTLWSTCQRFVSGIHKNKADAEFAFGKAGLLNAILQLSFLVRENEALIRTGDELAKDILDEICSFSSMSASPIRFLGFAHGWSGILYSLLSWGRHHNEALVKAVVPFLHAINDYKVPCHLGSYWQANFDHPRETGDTPSWCTGSGGFILLWTEAFEATKDGSWLTLAQEAGKHVALHQDMAFDLCCGLAGRAFCLGALYRCTGEIEWLEHARQCISRAKPTAGNFLHSLFKGIPGIELARAELRQPQTMTFPLLAADRYGERMSISRFFEEK